jgi:hypothetical protein
MSTANSELLSRIVAKHETFWAALAKRSQGTPLEHVTHAWMTNQWDPWYTAYLEETQGSMLGENQISLVARGLTALRALARSPEWGLPVPIISESASAATSVAGHGGGHGGGGRAPARPFARPHAYRRSAHGFRARGGWYRHGSRFPGRWWWGPAGWMWVESDVNLVAPEEFAPEDSAPENAPTAQQQPIAPEAQGEPADDVSTEAADAAQAGADQDSAEATNGASVVSSGDNPIVDAINRQTDLRFWAETGYKVGHPLDRNNPRDRMMLPAWLRARYQVAQEFHTHASDPNYLASLEGSNPAPSLAPQIPSWQYLPPKREVPVSASGSLVSLGAVISPGANTSVTFTRNGSTLTASVCIDGRCSQGSIDLADLIDDRVREIHPQLHAQARELVGTMPAAEDSSAAGAVLVGALLERDAIALCGSWWSSLTKEVKGAARSAAGTIGHTLHRLKGPIGVAAGAAAGAAAMAIPGAGPVLAPMAASMASSLVSAATGDAHAQQVVKQAVQQAGSDKTVARALEIAQKAAAQTTAAAHVVSTVDQAAAGVPQAQVQVQELAQAANAGDQGAQQALAVAQQVAQGTANDAAIVSGAVPDWRAVAKRTAERAHGDVIGFCKPVGNDIQVKHFDSSDDADDWFGRWLQMPDAYEYVAYFDRNDLTFPGPLNERFGGHHAAVVSSGHWILPMALGGALGAAGVTAGPRAWGWLRGKFAH